MRIEYSKEFQKHLESMDRPTKQRIKQAIEKLPSGDIKKLVGRMDDYRLRVGNYRVLFSQTEHIIIIKDVLPRGQAYKRI